MQISITHAHSSIPVPWHGRWNKSYTLLYRESSARYLHNVYESSTAGRERERMVKTGREWEREGVTEREGGESTCTGRVHRSGSEKVLYLFQTYWKATHTAWATYFIIKFIKRKQNNNQTKKTNNTKNGCKSVLVESLLPGKKQMHASLVSCT